MKTLFFAGYFEKSLDKEFDFAYVNDKTLLDLMSSENPSDRYLLADWNHINPDLFTDRAFDWNEKKYISASMLNSDSVVMLATPTKISTHVSLDKVNPLWIKMEEMGIPGVNPAASCLNYGDKSYFMKHPELPFPKTFLANYDSLDLILNQLGSSLIIKPLDTDGGYGVHRIENKQEKVMEMMQILNNDSPLILQEFIPEISQGERSLYFFDKKFKYAMIKRPKQGEFRSNWKYVDLLAPYIPTENELKIAQNAIETIQSLSVLERVDMVSSGKIIELTLDCPGLYLEEAGIEDKIGKWFYESVNASIRNSKR
ncbi:MAG: hypothetical protein WC867_02215 [Candidatus Pacearchaeota archaeon]|jgi:hypothetical protein